MALCDSAEISFSDQVLDDNSGSPIEVPGDAMSSKFMRGRPGEDNFPSSRYISIIMVKVKIWLQWVWAYRPKKVGGGLAVEKEKVPTPLFIILMGFLVPDKEVGDNSRSDNGNRRRPIGDVASSKLMLYQYWPISQSLSLPLSKGQVMKSPRSPR